MRSHRLLALVPLVALGVACQTAFASTSGAPPQTPSPGLLPPARQALDVRVAEQEPRPSLAHVVDLLSAATGVTFTANSEVRGLLEREPCGLRGSIQVPAAEAWVWAESLLHQGGFSLGILSADAPPLVAIYAMDPRSQNVRVFTDVPSSDVAGMAEHPALLVRTWLCLPHTDVRQLGNSLRGLTHDRTGLQEVMPVGNTSCVILAGSGRDVAAVTRLLVQMDEAEAARMEGAQPKPGGEGAR